jgi:hypothetical protein
MAPAVTRRRATPPRLPQGTQSRSATLTVNPLGLHSYMLTVNPLGLHSYTLTAPSGSAKYSITNMPNRLTASSTSGSLTTAAKTITFKIASGAANKLTPSTYLGSINFNNTTTSQVDATVLASLTVAPPNSDRLISQIFR